ncbi:nitrous oxide reductase accessory protein NosL [Paenibacillus lemnae]|uniref:Copper chaperone NosL n=1 Tax=Paenibacillus lemnae TaxID=1330551 RepID=A0A848M147_PAELE|nr:nitrous oxide reductase accessory protein NosL [Paenibacillus lemnae]NMO94485.1 hypothetical protein [Paenibacillus lemnae]
MKTMLKLMLISIVVVLTAGCGKEEYAAVPIDENVDKCVVCNMQIKDDQYAVQLQLKDYKTLKFDDLGDMYVWTKEHGEDNIGAKFVRDYYTKEWLHLKDAVYVYDENIRTPMAFGVLSFKDQASADKFVQEHGMGTLMTSAELENHEWKSGMDMMDDMHGDGEHGHGSEAHDTSESDEHGGNSGHE